MENNLFYYATSELSQDAFLAWLMSYAMKDCKKDLALKTCAQDFLRECIPELKGESDIWLSVAPQRQYKHIDVLLTVNDRYKVIIEDKTFTSEHDNQLQIYVDTIKKDFPSDTVYGIYYKTGFQSDLSQVLEAGYKICDRETALRIFSKCKTKNSIFRDYVDYLTHLEERARSYQVTEIEQWDWVQICGFFSECKKRFEAHQIDTDFGYVHNPSGGFYALWENSDFKIQIGQKIFTLYFQCNFSFQKLTFDIRMMSNSDDTTITSFYRDKLVKKNKKYIFEEFHFKKPNRYGTGKTVSLCLYDLEIHTSADALNQLPTIMERIRCARAAFQENIAEITI